MPALNGTIKRLVSDKGFGFILAEDGNEYFFHQSACVGIQFDQLTHEQVTGRGSVANQGDRDGRSFVQAGAACITDTGRGTHARASRSA